MTVSLARDSPTDRAPICRIALTTPPATWFHGIARAIHDHYRQALLDLGLQVFDVPVDAFVPPDAVLTAKLIEQLREFKPDLALGLPHGSYALLCRLPARRDGWHPNLFTDVLEVPTICLWDHAPVELADQLLAPHPAHPAESALGAMDALHRALAHPRLIHWSRDSGQTRIMTELGLLPPHRVIHELPPALPGFCAPESSVASRRHDVSVAFVGHFYQDPPAHPHPALAALAERTIKTWLNPAENIGCEPLWDVLGRQIKTLPASLLRELALDHDHTYFWSFAHRLIVHQAQTVLRFKMLGAAGAPVACYGNLRADQPGVPQNLLPLPGEIPFGEPLAVVLARHAITIDVLNPGFVDGCSHKPMLAFAAGGFLLLDRKQDFVAAFGDAGEAVSYRGADELAAKIECFLSAPRYRREVRDALREQILARYSIKDVLGRVLQGAWHCMEEMGTARNARPALQDNRSTRVKSMLAAVSCQPHWVGAGIVRHHGSVLISTPAQAWAYAAQVVVPPDVQEMYEPHLRIRILVESGRIGVAAQRDDTGELIAEQLISAAGRPVVVTVELPRAGASLVILRNAGETASRALLSEAVLCDRRP